MGILQKMPPLAISTKELKKWGNRWLTDINDLTGKTKNIQAFDRQQSMNFTYFLDLAFGRALAGMLGNIPVEIVKGNNLLPPHPDCVEVGAVRIVGGVRPQNFDAAYRPDGPRVAFDSKTLNDIASVRKNWQNMINDLGTEATTVHTRFPYALVVFMIVIPRPALPLKQERDIIRTLERLSNRKNVLDQPHLAEAISLVLWEPTTGEIVTDVPKEDSSLRIEKLPLLIEELYNERYKGLPPHN